jgi:NADH dehydrogenase
MPHIVIIGAGFVGLSTARQLRKQKPSLSITLIDAKDTFLFTPRLIDALQSTDYPREAYRADLRAIAKNEGFTFIQGYVNAIDRAAKKIEYIPSTSNEVKETLTYDLLVLAQGAQPCFYGLPGVAVQSLPLKTEEDLHHIHDRVRTLLKETDTLTSDQEKKRRLAFAAVGAGPSGVEAICALKLFTEALCDSQYPSLKPHLSWTLLQGGPQILPGFPMKLVNGAKTALERQGISVQTGVSVTGMNKGEILTAQNSIPANLILWTAGIEGVNLNISPTIQTERGGYLPVDHTFYLAPHIFAAGDTVLYRESNVVIPKNAQTAMQMAKTVTKNIIHTLENRPLVSFRYASKGNIITVGHTGFLDAKYFVLQTRFSLFLRNFLYRLRFWQMTGL